MNTQHWLVRQAPPEEFYKRFPEQSRILTALLFQRGQETQEAVDAFLEPEYSHDPHDPFLFRDMEKAVARILTALKKKEKITIYGDYDADGVAGAAVLFCTLREFGITPDVYIPYRMTEGYGMNLPAIEEIAKGGSTLIITNDLGITNVEEIALAHERGVDVIISDHHTEPEKLPDAYAIVNPAVKAETYPFARLSGTGVSYKLATALLKRSVYAKDFRETPLPEGWEKWLLDLVAIGTVADIMPLVDENRSLVTFGLAVMRKTRRKGLLALEKTMRTALRDANTQSIGFQIAPRLNSAGRLKHASTAFQLLVTDDDQEAASLAEDLERTNRERQTLTDSMAREAIQQIGTPDEKTKIVFAEGEGWQRGVVGIVAGKLVHHYGLPAIVAGKDSDVNGSGRSVSAFNMIEAVQQCSAGLTKFGGHPQACGFTAKDQEAYATFKQCLTKAAAKALTNEDLRPELHVDMEITFFDITWDLLDDLERLEPFGEANPQPRFLIKDVAITDFSTVGAEGDHLRMTLTQGEISRKTIAFRRGKDAERLTHGTRLDIVAVIEKNEWNGMQSLQLRIEDFMLHQQ
ncbi:MAG: single-stranded-DNA-specific exonuclease RecJ [Patescibacteria group bacterium]|jgi:single-stranded-DNA-specific exonuclease